MSDDIFARPPREVTRFLEAKGMKPSFDWRDFSFDEHAYTFTAAKTVGYNVVGDLKAAMQQAVRERLAFAEFQKLVEPTLRAKGWWGKQTIVDPLTGEAKVVTIGARRLRTIYWANTRTAYGAGQFERAWRTREVLPYLVYVESTALHKRELHLAWVGVILPVEHPWWRTHFPPSAWGCMCRVRQASEYEAREIGYDPDAPPPSDDFSYSWVNERTGEVSRVPIGVDPGWGGNPAFDRLSNAGDLMIGKIDGMSDAARLTAAQDVAQSPLAQTISAGEAPFDPNSVAPAQVGRGKVTVPVGALDDAMAADLGAQRKVVTLSVKDASAIRAATPDLAPNWIDTIQPSIEAGRMRAAGGGLYVLELEDGRRASLVDTGVALAVTAITEAD